MSTPRPTVQHSARRYFPRPLDTFRGKTEMLFRSLSYRIWKRRLRSFFTGVSEPRIADIGCGPGFLLSCLGEWFPSAQLTGVDASEQLLQFASARCGKATLLEGNACSIPLASASQDVVFALHVVEHLEEPERFFIEAYRVLRPGGRLIFATPNLSGIGARLMKEKWGGYSDSTHISLNRPAVWRRSVVQTGFHVVTEGTTGLTGIPMMNKMPLGLIHWIPTFIFGHFPWSLGEAYICTAQRPGQ